MLIYVMARDEVRPKRHWILRHGGDGLWHWGLKADLAYTGALPWCYEETNTRLRVFFAARAVDTTVPTCLWCARQSTRPVRERGQRGGRRSRR